MQSSRFPYLTLSDEIGEVSAQHPITLERLQRINRTASVPVKRRRSLHPYNRTTNTSRISMADATHDQPDTMAPPQTPFDLESFLSEEDRQFVARMGAVSPFVSHIMKKLNEAVATIIRSNIDEGASTAEIKDIHQSYVKEASHAIRRIYTVWSKYPQAGGALGGAKINIIDYRYSATHAVEGTHESLSFKIAIFMANTIDSKDIEFQTVAHEQKRINGCRAAMKQTYKIWQTRLDPPRSLSDDALLAELTSESASPITYTMQPPLGDAPTMTKPTTPAEMMSSAALAEQAEYEMHDNVHIFVGGGKVLKNQAEKRSDLAQQLDLARKAEAKEAKEAKKAKKAQDAVDARAASKSKGHGKKSTVLVGSSSENEEVDEQPAPKKPGRKPARVTKTLKRPSEDEAEDGNDGNTAMMTPTPRKKSRKAANEDASNDVDSEKTISEPNDGSEASPKGTSAPENARLGGAAQKWLKDEDDLGKQLVVDNPTWEMPKIYQEFNRLLANTAYKTDKMGDAHDYRSDWIEFPRRDASGNKMNDKAARKFDICWRTYESVRQHLEKHKAKVSNPRELKPITWNQLTKNPVDHLPKRDPPPRPDFFKDGKTPVPQLEDESSAAEDDSAEDAPMSEPENTSGWNAINKPFGRTPSPLDSSPMPAPKKGRASKAKASKDLPRINTAEYAQPVVLMQPATPADAGRSAPGDDNIDSVEDYVAGQSDGEDGDDELAQAQVDGPTPSRSQQGTLSGRPAPSSRPVLSNLPPEWLSRRQGLPSGWTQDNETRRGHNYGRPYYLNHNEKKTTWSNPTSEGYNSDHAFSVGNATVPAYPIDYVWADDQFVPRSSTDLPTSGPLSSYSDLGISNLPADHRPARATRAPATGRRPAAATATTDRPRRTTASTPTATTDRPRRTTASAPTATVGSASRPSMVVKLPIKRRPSAEKKSDKDDEPEA